MNGRRYNARYNIMLLALGMALAGVLTTEGYAQIEVGSNTSMTMTGDLGFGYDASSGDTVQSSHGTSFNGDAVLQGYYYNPKFLNFTVTPVYNRSQANSGAGSITNATSINAGVNLFSGSHFPGSIGYGEAFNSSGNYGFGTIPGFTTTGNSRSFNIGWSELLPGLPPVSVQYTQNTTSSSIFGTDENDHTSTKNLNLFSNYKLDGWFMGAHFVDTWTSAELPSAVTGGEAVTGDTNGKVFSFNATHRLPLRGSFGANYSWSDFSGENNGVTSSGSNQTVTATAAFAPTQRFTTSFQATYDSNLAGAITQQLIGAGAVTPEVNLGTSSYSMSFSNIDNYAIGKGLSLGFDVNHIQQEVYGETIGATHWSAIVNYQFLKPLWGHLVFYAGVNDQAADGTNLGAGLIAGASFSKQWSTMDVSASFAYAQNTETVLATETTSSYSYNAIVQRRLTRRVRWMGSFNGFRTGQGPVEGQGAHAENYGTNLVFKMYNLGANYSHTSGTVLLAANGYILPPGTIPPGLTGNQYLLDTGSSYGVNFTANPLRRFSIGASFQRAINDSLGVATPTNADSKVMNFFTTYQFRKLVLTAGYSNLNQFVSASGFPAANYTNYYAGIQRWFKFF